MAANLKDIEAQIAQLSAEDRSRLLHRLIAALDASGMSMLSPPGWKSPSNAIRTIEQERSLQNQLIRSLRKPSPNSNNADALSRPCQMGDVASCALL